MLLTSNPIQKLYCKI